MRQEMHLTQRRRWGWVIGDTENRFTVAASLFPFPLSSPHRRQFSLVSPREFLPLFSSLFLSSSHHLPALPSSSPDSGAKGGSSRHRRSSLCHTACGSYRLHTEWPETKRLRSNLFSFPSSNITNWFRYLNPLTILYLIFICAIGW